MGVTFLGGSLNHPVIWVLFLMLLVISYRYSILYIVEFIQSIYDYNYLNLYRKYVKKKDKAKEIDFKYIQRLIKKGKI